VAQKQRHFTAAPYYKLRDKLLLITEPASRMMFYITFIILVSRLFFWQAVLVVFGLRLILQTIVLVLCQKRLCEPGLTGFSLFFDILSPSINALVYLSSKRKRQVSNTWR